LRRQRLRPMLILERDEATLWAPTVTDGTLAFAETAHIPLAGDAAAITAAGRAAIEALARSYGPTPTAPRILIVLPGSQVLRKTLTLPAAIEENLVQALAYDLDRHTPFKPEDVYFDAVVAARDPARKEIRVDWAAALKSVVDQARRRAESWGATVVGVTPESPQSATALSGAKLNLLPASERLEVSTWRRGEIWIPVAAIAVIAVIA